MKTLRIGSGAGYGGDRIEPALDLIERGDLDYIGFECLAERTIALAQRQKLKDPSTGYNELLEYRMERMLPLLRDRRVRVITNMGAANPLAAAGLVRAMAAGLGMEGFRVAAITGDDVLGRIDRYLGNEILETGERLESIASRIISANAYIGSLGIVDALRQGADIVIGGRIADPSLFLAPLMYGFGWNPDDYERIGKGILAGHMLECSSQVTGGYFADPGWKEVPELWNVGFPIAEVDESGDFVITKLEGSGGLVSPATCKEQIIYEIHDPANYHTPDGVADYRGVTVDQAGKDRVRVRGATGKAGSGLLKVSVGYSDGFIGEGEISYGGPGARERAALAGSVVRRRLEHLGIPLEELRIEHMGVDSLYGDRLGERLCARSGDGVRGPCEVRLRVAARAADRRDAERIGNEVEALYLNGPSGGGGARKYLRDVISVASIFIDRNDVAIAAHCEEVRAGRGSK